ncbi:DUF3124 domain-containing protein [Marivirga atlantica]|jgi:hypothetical protein
MFNRAVFSRYLLIFLLSCSLILTVVIIARVHNFSDNLTAFESKQVSKLEAIRLEAMKDIQFRMGQEVYVPVYSSLKLDNESYEIDFSITLSIRNTDTNHPLIVRSIDYYNSEGEKFKRFVSKRLTLPPMGTTDIVINRSDNFGKSGGNFYVVWTSDTLISEPIVQAIMLGPGPNGYSFLSEGRVVKSKK